MIKHQATMLSAITISGPIPTMLERVVTWSAISDRRFWVQRFVVSPCLGQLMATSIKIGNQEMLAETRIDLHLVGSLNAFGVRLEFPAVDAGALFSVKIEWVPPPMTYLMSRRELAKRRKSGDWSVTWNGLRMRIDGNQATDLEIAKSRRYGVEGFVPWPQPIPQLAILARVDLSTEDEPKTGEAIDPLIHTGRASSCD